MRSVSIGLLYTGLLLARQETTSNNPPRGWNWPSASSWTPSSSQARQLGTRPGEGRVKKGPSHPLALGYCMTPFRSMGDELNVIMNSFKLDVENVEEAEEQ